MDLGSDTKDDRTKPIKNSSLDVASHGSTWLHMAPPIPAFLRLPHVAAHILRQIQRVFCNDARVLLWDVAFGDWISYRDPKCSAAGMARVSPCPFSFLSAISNQIPQALSLKKRISVRTTQYVDGPRPLDSRGETSPFYFCFCLRGDLGFLGDNVSFLC